MLLSGLVERYSISKDIKMLCEWKEKEGRLPERKDIDPETRRRLQKVCGSWENALRQLEYRKR